MSAKSRGRLLIAGSLLAAVALAGSYLAAGGASYVPAKTQNPCKPRPWGNPEGIQAIAERFPSRPSTGPPASSG